MPLYKTGGTKDLNNYHGITLVSHIAKLFTTIVNNRLTEWCARYNVVSDAQFGFLKKRRFRPLMQFSAYSALLRSI